MWKDDATATMAESTSELSRQGYESSNDKDKDYKDKE